MLEAVGFSGVDAHGSVFCDPTTSWLRQKLDFSEYNIKIFHVKFIFRNAKSCKHDMREEYA